MIPAHTERFFEQVARRNYPASETGTKKKLSTIDRKIDANSCERERGGEDVRTVHFYAYNYFSIIIFDYILKVPPPSATVYAHCCRRRIVSATAHGPVFMACAVRFLTFARRLLQHPIRVSRAFLSDFNCTARVGLLTIYCTIQHSIVCVVVGVAA